MQAAWARLRLAKCTILINGSYQEGILDYMDMLPVVKEVDGVFIGQAIQMQISDFRFRIE
jgi:hypothetical protein